MKLFKFFKPKKPSALPLPIVAANLNPGEVDLKPSPGEVAKRAYLRYVNQGSLPGHDQRHWLEAEAQLVAERSLARVYLFRNWT